MLNLNPNVKKEYLPYQMNSVKIEGAINSKSIKKHI